MSILKKILKAQLSTEDMGEKKGLVPPAEKELKNDGLAAAAKPKRADGNAELDPSAKKPPKDSPEVKDKKGGTKVDPNAPATVDSSPAAGIAVEEGAEEVPAIDPATPQAPAEGAPAELPPVETPAEEVPGVEVPEDVFNEVEAATDIDADEVEDQLVEVGTEVDTVGAEADDIAVTTDAADSLEETVATMEAMLERGFVSEAELQMVVRRGQRRLQRLDIFAPTLSSEAMSSEEGRMEALSYAKEDFKEKAGQVRDAVKGALSKLKERLGSAVKQLFSVNERLSQRALSLESAVNAIKGGEAKAQSLKLSRDDHRFLTDVEGKLLDPKAVAARVKTAAHEILVKYPGVIAATAADKPLPKINSNVLTGLPAGLTMEMSPDGFPVFRTTRLSDKSDRSDVKVVSPDVLAAIVASVKGAVDELKSDAIAKALNQSGDMTDEQLHRVDDQISYLIDFYFYVQRVLKALLGFVAAQVKQYGVKAQA